MVVLVLTAVPRACRPPHRWLLEIAPGVYVGHLTRRVRIKSGTELSNFAGRSSNHDRISSWRAETLLSSAPTRVGASGHGRNSVDSAPTRDAPMERCRRGRGLIPAHAGMSRRPEGPTRPVWWRRPPRPRGDDPTRPLPRRDAVATIPAHAGMRPHPRRRLPTGVGVARAPRGCPRGGAPAAVPASSPAHEGSVPAHAGMSPAAVDAGMEAGATAGSAPPTRG